MSLIVIVLIVLTLTKEISNTKARHLEGRHVSTLGGCLDDPVEMLNVFTCLNILFVL